jgi:hypothetical protein
MARVWPPFDGVWIPVGQFFVHDSAFCNDLSAFSFVTAGFAPVPLLDARELTPRGPVYPVLMV